MREAAEAKAKRDVEATVRARAWAEAEAKEKSKIVRITAEAGGRSGQKLRKGLGLRLR